MIVLENWEDPRKWAEKEGESKKESLLLSVLLSSVQCSKTERDTELVFFSLEEETQLESQ